MTREPAIELVAGDLCTGDAAELLSRYLQPGVYWSVRTMSQRAGMVRSISSAVLFTALGLGFAMAQSSATSPPGTAWLELRRGVKAYTGDDGGGAKTLTVCTSAYFYKKWFSSTTAVVPECVEKPRGIPVTVASDQIFMPDNPDLVGEYFVFIRADDSSWSGWTGSGIGLQPRIPAHTKVVVKALVPGGEKWFFPSKISAAGHIVLSDGAALEILAQDAKSDGPDLYAQIIGSSRDAGKKGWLHLLGLNLQGDGPLIFGPPNGTKPQR